MSNCFATPWDVICQAPLSKGFPRQEYWSGLPLPSPGDLPDPEFKSGSTVLQADFSLASNINHKCGVLINHNLWRIMVRLDLGKVSQEEGGDEGGAEGWPWWLLDLGARDMCSLHLSSHITQSQQCYLKGAPVPALAGWFDIFLRMLMEAVCYLVELVGFAIRCEFSQSGHLLTMWP